MNNISPDYSGISAKLIKSRKRASSSGYIIIGVGIALVVFLCIIPKIIDFYNKDTTETKLKKFYSVMNQAIKYSEIENGETPLWDYWTLGDDKYDEEGNVIDNSELQSKLFDKYIGKYVKVSSTKQFNSKKNRISRKLYYMSDGSAFAYMSNSNIRDIVYYPKNAEDCIVKIPKEQYGACAFVFNFYPVNNSPDWSNLYGKKLEPYLGYWNQTEDALYTDEKYGCKPSLSQTNGYYCTALIVRNGWKVPQKYPKKIRY